MSNPDDQPEPRDVLSSLPRSRRQRPSARREAARAGRAAPKKAAPKKATAAKPRPKAQPKAARAPRAAARKPPPKRSAIPPAGYATPREGSGHGSADPGAAIAGLVRGILRRLPF